MQLKPGISIKLMFYKKLNSTLGVNVVVEYLFEINGSFKLRLQ
jgi:hypothetical protein